MDIVASLKRPDAFPHSITNPTGKVEHLQTHISWVFLTGDYAYKVKKPVNFGFLDFTDKDQRHHFCQEELRINSHLSPDIYLEVLPLVAEAGHDLGLAGWREPQSPIDNLVVGTPGQEGEALDWCLKMKQLDQAHLMPIQLEAGVVTEKTMTELARAIAEFHEQAPTGETNDQGETIDEHGSLETVRFNCQENFDQTRDLRGKLIAPEIFDAIELATNAFLDHNAVTFTSRINNGRIRECHGDLHAGNIFVLPEGQPVVFDAIEFNRRFSCSDVAAEVAFLAMDLEHRGYPELAHTFIQQYVEASDDDQLPDLLPFYQAYRAYVRAKVTSFRFGDDLEDEQRQVLESEVKAYFQLAHGYLCG